MADEAEMLLSDALEETIDGTSPAENDGQRLHPAPAAPPLPEGLPLAQGQTTADLPHDGAILEVGEEPASSPTQASEFPRSGQMGGQGHHQSTDSITLGQLKGHMFSPPKPKVRVTHRRAVAHEHRAQYYLHGTAAMDVFLRTQRLCIHQRRARRILFVCFHWSDIAANIGSRNAGRYTEIPSLVAEGQEAWEKGWNAFSKTGASGSNGYNAGKKI